MNIEIVNENKNITLKLEGWLDTAASPELGEKIDAITEASSIVLDFDAVEYIASSGVRQIVATHRKAAELGASFAVINVNSEIMSILQLTGIDKKLDIRAK